MIILAYDGSLNGDWVSRYAIRFAAHTGSVLSVLNVRDGSVTNDQMVGKLRRLEYECRTMGVEAVTDILPEERDVCFTLMNHIPSGTGNIVVCGTRVRSRQQRFLSGTVSEKLLRTGLFPVMALRVVQPGLLGAPRDLLLPFSGQPGCFEEAWTFFRLLLPDLDRLFLMRWFEVSAIRLPNLSMARRDAMRQIGERYLAEIGEEIIRRSGDSMFRLDWRIGVCDDWVNEVLVQASRLKVGMVMLSASEGLFDHRFLHGNDLERLLRGTPCDVGIYRSL